jgi:hypothetical protein
MKVTINGWLFHKQYRHEDTPTYEFCHLKDWADESRVIIMEHSIEVDIPDDFDPIPAKIANLRKEKQRIQAEAHVKAENIEQQIQELLCIENKVTV